MTRNLYLGTALDNVTAASNFAEFVQAVSQDWAHVVATDFPTRAKALAAEILRAKPDVVGLQEVSLWRDQDVSDIVTGTTAPNATHVVYDFLAMVQAELRAGGTAYSAVSTSTNADVEAPRSNSASPNGFTDVRLTDRDVILVRAELADKFSGAASGHYKDQFTVPSVVGPLTFTRGWASIDYRHDANRTVRIIDTHLEIEAGPAGTTQVAQGTNSCATWSPQARTLSSSLPTSIRPPMAQRPKAACATRIGVRPDARLAAAPAARSPASDLTPDTAAPRARAARRRTSWSLPLQTSFLQACKIKPGSEVSGKSGEAHLWMSDIDAFALPWIAHVATPAYRTVVRCLVALTGLLAGRSRRGTGGVRATRSSRNRDLFDLLKVEPMTGIEPAYSAWESDVGAGGLGLTCGDGVSQRVWVDRG